MNKTYDKLSWHYPEGRGCPSAEAAAALFEGLMGWLSARDLLSEEGRELAELPIDEDFALTSSMLAPAGQRLLDERYANWLAEQDYGRPPSFEALGSA